MIYYIILILIIVGLMLIIWKLMQDKKESEKEVGLIEKEKEEFGKMSQAGLAEYNLKLQKKKQQAKNKILEMLGAKQKQGGQAKLSSVEVCKELGISRSSVARYFDELEKDGKAKQVGKWGQAVYYQKIG